MISPRVSRLAWIAALLVACSTPGTTTQKPETAQAARAAAAPAIPAPTAPRTEREPAAAEAATPAAAPDTRGVALGKHGAVASAEANASRVGIEILKAGGNAVDAAVAVAFALAVTHPTGGNLGGGGFMVVRMANGESAAIDYREVAPLAATRDMYRDGSGKTTPDSVRGPRAAGIPGTVAGLAFAHEHFGKLPWAQLVAPAIALARDGHVLDGEHAADMADAVQRMHEAGFDETAKLYLSSAGKPLAAGETWKQPALASSLELIAKQGAKTFYTGTLARSLARGVKKLGGIWSTKDLAGYRAVSREPLRFTYLGQEIVTMPPPSGGGIVLRQILFASELFSLREKPWRSAAAMHVYLEAARRAYADRNSWIADPDFVKVPVAELTSPEYLRARMRTIDLQHATPSSQVQAGAPIAEPHESPETTHFAIVDEAGDAVANTYTLNASFGALVAVPGTGILLNDEMDDFAVAPGTANMYGLVQGERNAVAPKKRMLSSMTPTILVENGKLRAVLGTPGGPTITTTVVQLVRALVDYARPLDEAVRAARLHHQWLPDRVLAEPEVEPEILAGLRALGHTIYQPGSHIGQAHCIEVVPGSGEYRAVADVTRSSGEALAY